MHIAILDPNRGNAQPLCDIMKKKYADWIVSIYSSTFELATAVYDELKGDVDLLMVYAQNQNIELAKDLQEFFPQIRLIFYSEKTTCAEEIFRANPCFFLLLPFKEDYVELALERVKRSWEEDVRKTIVIESHGRKQKIRFSVIQYIESVGRKMFLYTDDGVFETYMTMRAILSLLPSEFVQCHRSYVINSNRIDKCNADMVVLTAGESVPISRTYHKKVFEIVK